MDILKKIIILAVAAALLYLAVPPFFNQVLDNLETQRDAEKSYNCAHYGAAMNKYYGREVCPPTPHG